MNELYTYPLAVVRWQSQIIGLLIKCGKVDSGYCTRRRATHLDMFAPTDRVAEINEQAKMWTAFSSRA